MFQLSRKEKEEWISKYRIKQFELQEERYWERYCYYLDKGYYQLEAKNAAVIDLQDYYEDRQSVMGMTRKELDYYCMDGGYALKDIRGAYKPPK